MNKYLKPLGLLMFFSLLFLTPSCQISFNDMIFPKHNGNKDNTNKDKDNPDNKNQQNESSNNKSPDSHNINTELPDISNGDDEGSGHIKTDDSEITEESTVPESKYEPEPDNITTSSPIKLNRHNINNNINSNYMYLMVRFLGDSAYGFWRKSFGEKIACPKGFALNYNGIEATTILNFNELNEQDKMLVGYVNDFDLGFTNFSGNKFYTTFYYTDENMKVPINSNNDITFSYASFAIWDPTINGEFMESAHPDFVRYPNNRLKITVPMKDYNPEIHNNVVYLTVYFEPDKKTDNCQFPYIVVLDGFEPK